MKTSITIFILMLFHTIISAQHEWEIIFTNITEDLHDVEFINDSVGFVYSYGTGNIYKTTDEGNNWKIIKQTDSIYLEQIQFVNSEIGWICGELGTILKTYDGGQTWADISIELNDKNLLLYGMCFLNDSIGYLSGAVLSENTLDPTVYLTIDGGSSWSEVYNDLPKMILNLVKKDNELFATGTGFIIRIDLQTKKWEYVLKDTTRAIGQIRDIQFANDKYGMAVSFNGNILITNNGGDSFTSKAITTNRLRSLAYLGGNNWVAVGDNNKSDGAVLYFSNDDGENWEKNNDFPDIHRIGLTEKNIWIVGKKGLIAKMKRK